MSGKKYATARYTEYMKSILKMMSGDFFSSLRDGENLAIDSDKTHEYTNLTQLIMSLQTAIDTLAKDDPKPRESACIYEEKNIEKIKTVFNDAFKAYKTQNPNAKDENFRGPYRKFEYIQAVLDMYDTAQLDFESFDITKDDKKVEIDPVFDAEADKSDIKAELNKYKDISYTFNRNVTNYENFLQSVEFDPEILPEELKDNFNVDVAIKNIDKINGNIITQIDDINNKITELINQSSTQNQNDKKDLDVKLSKIDEELKSKIAELLGKRDIELEEPTRIRDEAETTFNRLNADKTTEEEYDNRINEYRSAEFDNVSEKFKYGGRGTPEGAENLGLSRDFWAFNKNYLSDEDLDKRINENTENIEKLKARNADLQQEYSDLQDKVGIRKQFFESAEKDLKDFESGKSAEAKDLNNALKNAEKSAKEVQDLIDTLNTTGLKNIKPETLKQYNLGFSLQARAAEEKERQKSLNEIYKHIGNDKSPGKYWTTETNESKALGKAVQDLNRIFNKEWTLGTETVNGKEVKRLTANDEKYRGEDGIPFIPVESEAMYSRIRDSLDVLEEFAARRGQIYTFEDAICTYRLSQAVSYMQMFADALPDEERYKGVKEDIAAANNAIGKVMEGKAGAEIIKLASGNELFGTEKDKVKAITKPLTAILNKRKDAVNEAKGNIEEKLKEKHNTYDTLKKHNEDIAKELENTQKEYKQNKLDIKYLESSNALTSAIKNDIKYKKDLNEAKKTYNEAREKCTNLKNKYEVVAAKRLIDIYDGKKKAATAEYNQSINLRKTDFRSRLASYKNKLKTLDNLKTINENLGFSKGEVKSQVERINTKIKDLNVKSQEAIARIENNRANIVKSLGETEQSVFKSMISTKKAGIFGDSGYFTQMKEAMQAYFDAKEHRDKKKLTKKDFKELIETARKKVEIYVDKRKTSKPNEKKGTESGQNRLDCAKRFLQLFDMQESMLGQLDIEKQNILNSKENYAIETNSKLETEIVKSVGHQEEFRYSEKINAVKRDDIVKGMEKIGKIFSPITEYIKGKSGYLSSLYEKGVNGLSKANYKGFTEGISAVLVAAVLSENPDKMALYEKNPVTLDIKYKQYMETPEVKSIVSDLLHEKLKPEDFVENLKNPDYTKQMESNVKRHLKHIENLDNRLKIDSKKEENMVVGFGQLK